MKRKRKAPTQSVGEQVSQHSKKAVEDDPLNTGDFGQVISTGSTLLDLAISGGIVNGGGLPGGIFVEIFGPSGSGKTTLLCEIAGNVARKEGDVMFLDPEARLNSGFARMFGFEVDACDYDRPDTVPQIFEPVRKWEPESQSVNGIFADSLAALSTEMEMESEDKMGMRRAKEFSEHLRKTCRVLKNKNFLMVCSNQIRSSGNTGYGEKSIAPGGKAIEFYSSLRLQIKGVKKLKKSKKVAGKEQTRVFGVEVNVYVAKSSIWEPYHEAPLYIVFDYGVDDIRANLQWLKDNKRLSQYELNGESLGKSMDKAVQVVEDEKKEKHLRKEVIEMWQEIQDAFRVKRKPKRRF